MYPICGKVAVNCDKTGLAKTMKSGMLPLAAAFLVSLALVGPVSAQVTDLAVLSDRSAKITGPKNWRCASRAALTVEAGDAGQVPGAWIGRAAGGGKV